MRPACRALGCVVLAGLVGCATQSPDPFLAAEGLAASGAFLQALPLLDKVPPTHQHYGEARALAQALERRMRTSQELVLRGMAMRNEWRDKEALRHFEHALEIWPSVAGAETFIQATKNRMSALEEVRQTEQVVAPPGGGDPGFGQLHTVPVGIETLIPGNKKPDPKQPETEDLRVARQLRAVKGHLDRGEMEQAMDVLETLMLDYPENQAVASRFARVLHQRALVRYGSGFLEGAIEDWKRLLKMRPAHRQAAAFLKAAETELKLRGRR
jgi:tetratricopeptide (TPR) repeat protein